MMMNKTLSTAQESELKFLRGWKMKDFKMNLQRLAKVENKRTMKICSPTQAINSDDWFLTEEMKKLYLLTLMKERPLWTLPMLQRKLKVKQCMIHTWLIELKKQNKVIKENGEWKLCRTKGL